MALRSKCGRFSGYEQHIAVFGESGSGKTTLLSAFYGMQQSPTFELENKYSVLAQDTDQGNFLLANYYTLQDPRNMMATRLKSTRYEFSVRPEMISGVRKDVLRLVWHDYPGEWLTENKEGRENEDKLNTFRKLIEADVAYFLVDAAKFKAEGVAYLRRLFSNFRNEMKRIGDALAERNDTPLKYFPRAWYICLSKADLVPEMNVISFKSEVEKVQEEIDAIQTELLRLSGKEFDAEFCSGYLLLSSLKMDPATLKVTNWRETKGVDVIAPLSFFAPFFKACKWAKVVSFSESSVAHVLFVAGASLKSAAPITSGLITPAAIAAYAMASGGTGTLLGLIPVVGGSMAAAGGAVAGAAAAAAAATPLLIATGVLAVTGFAAYSGGKMISKHGDESKSKFDGLKNMLEKFQTKLIEATQLDVCYSPELYEFVIGQKQCTK